jgi:hypothetical protein
MASDETDLLPVAGRLIIRPLLFFFFLFGNTHTTVSCIYTVSVFGNNGSADSLAQDWKIKIMIVIILFTVVFTIVAVRLT